MIAKFSLALLLCASAAAARAQEYPAREIRSICNFAAGSGADIIVRYYSERLSRLAGKPVLVENKPGVQGTLASDFVAKSRPDGYTLMITPASSTLATAPFIFKKLPFDPLKDFAAVTSVASLSFVLAVDAAGPIKSIDELVKVLKSKPGHGFYGTGSNTGQVAAELFKEKLGLSTVYVPYKVTVDALSGVVGGGVDFISYDTTWAVTQHPQRIRILAVTAAKRQSALPDIPTLSELGLGEFDIAPWFGVVVPAGTPRPIIERLNREVGEILRTRELKEKFATAGIDIVPSTPQELGERIRADLPHYGKLMREAGIQPE
jgi:tripartite-type tricarboxylate transporter receptor subunit TctC